MTEKSYVQGKANRSRDELVEISTDWVEELNYFQVDQP